MNIQFSFLDRNRSVIGFEVSRGARLMVDDNSGAQLQRTIEFTIGYLFGWITIQIDFGGKFNMDDVFEDMIKNINHKKL